MNKIKVVIVDDHQIFRDGLKLVLGQIVDIDVVAEFATGDDFLLHLPELSFDVVLMDIDMPGKDGIKTTEIAKNIKNEIKVIGLTMLNDEVSHLKMIESGANGFVLKKSGKGEVQHAIYEVYKGGNYFSLEILQKLALRIYKKKEIKKDCLTNREKEILIFICKGLSSKEISDKTNISPKTVEVHRARLLKKTDCKNTAQLIVWAIKNEVFLI